MKSLNQTICIYSNPIEYVVRSFKFVKLFDGYFISIWYLINFISSPVSLGYYK